MIDKQSQIRRVSTLINTLVRSNCFGEVTIKMESGNIVFVEIDENRRVSPEEAMELLSRVTTDAEGEIYVRPVKSNPGNGLSLVTKVTKGSLEKVFPLGE